MMYGYYGGWGMGSLMMISFWIIIAACIIWAVRDEHCHSEAKDKTALDILKERYAKGEINKEEFELKKKDLIK